MRSAEGRLGEAQETLRYEPRIRGARKTAWFVGAVWLLTLVNIIVFWDMARDRPGTPVGTSVCWGVFTLVAVRAARRRVDVHEDGPVLHGVLRRRRLAWADINEIEIVHTVSAAAAARHRRTHRQSTWRVRVRTRDGRSRAVPSFMHNVTESRSAEEMHRGAMPLMVVTEHTTAPPDAPQDLAVVHAAFRASLLRYAPARG